MKIVPVSMNEIENQNFYRRTKNQKILEEFLDSGLECCRLDGWTHKNATIAANAFQESAKRYGFGIDVFHRGNNVYLVRRK